jgi:membrane-associated phospholipid phosphatase
MTAALLAGITVYGLYAAGPLRQLDHAVFLFLNGLTGRVEWFDHLLILINRRETDYVVGGLILAWYLGYTFWDGKEYVLRRLKFGLVIAAMVLPLVVFCKVVDKQIGRATPALVYRGKAVDFQHVYPNKTQKYFDTNDSFPGDHGIVWFTFIWLAWFRNRKSAGWLLALGILALTPRLFVGGHWVTDDFGAILLAFIVPAIADAFLHFSDPRWGARIPSTPPRRERRKAEVYA